MTETHGGGKPLVGRCSEPSVSFLTVVIVYCLVTVDSSPGLSGERLSQLDVGFQAYECM